MSSVSRMPRLTAPLVWRKERTFSSSSRVPYWPYQARQRGARQDGQEDGEVPSVSGVARQGRGSVELDHDRLAERAGGRHPVEPGEVPDLVADRDAVEDRIRERDDGSDAVGEQEQPEPRYVSGSFFSTARHMS